MEYTLRILAIGDIHGRTIWKDIIHHYGLDNIDKIVFMGDYIDSFDIPSNIQIDNLKDIIQFKKDNFNKVELLIGNHDIQYYLPLSKLHKVKCSGYQITRYLDYNEIFRQHYSLFKIAYQHKNYLFSHAGIHRGWYHYRFKKLHTQETLADSLNLALQYEHDELWDCGYYRGGFQKVGGILWADFQETYKKPLAGYHQIVGHTRLDSIKTYKKGIDTSVTYIDTQEIEKDIKDMGYYIIV